MDTSQGYHQTMLVPEDQKETTFEELKEYLARFPLLVKPSLGDTLYVYLSATPQAVSFVLIRETKENICISIMSAKCSMEQKDAIPSSRK
ncbi:UNVERIFIED_CONTAM: hypothetical protein Sradi_2350500 [Sesamum radiatum]|uniref:Reverse transcriptase/retrotransposon-derived protein RNase H-like domain-containing protein n=1 Tax=Sesamum radiatum TaxID=300843 RepID=A0AAW2T6V1_SESRA